MAISSHSSRAPKLGRPPVQFRDNIIEPQTNIESFNAGCLAKIESMVPYQSKINTSKKFDIQHTKFDSY